MGWLVPQGTDRPRRLGVVIAERLSTQCVRASGSDRTNLLAKDPSGQHVIDGRFCSTGGAATRRADERGLPVEGGYSSLNALVVGALGRELERLAGKFNAGATVPAAPWCLERDDPSGLNATNATVVFRHEGGARESVTRATLNVRASLAPRLPTQAWHPEWWTQVPWAAAEGDRWTRASGLR